MNNNKLAEFLNSHKYNCENFNEEGNYDPNPYWFADEIIEFLNLHGVSKSFTVEQVVNELKENGKSSELHSRDRYKATEDLMKEIYNSKE